MFLKCSSNAEYDEVYLNHRPLHATSESVPFPSIASEDKYCWLFVLHRPPLLIFLRLWRLAALVIATKSTWLILWRRGRNLLLATQTSNWCAQVKADNGTNKLEEIRRWPSLQVLIRSLLCWRCATPTFFRRRHSCRIFVSYSLICKLMNTLWRVDK